MLKVVRRDPDRGFPKSTVVADVLSSLLQAGLFNSSEQSVLIDASGSVLNAPRSHICAASRTAFASRRGLFGDAKAT
jgi:hypothetical protein